MKLRKTWLAIAASLLATSCLHAGSGEQETLEKAQGAMRNLSKTMEACFKYENPPAELKGRELLEYCTQHNHGLRRFYKNFTMKFKQDQGYAVVLVCSKDGSRWLMEDISCSSIMDSPPTDNDLNKPCKFGLHADRDCLQLK